MYQIDSVYGFTNHYYCGFTKPAIHVALTWGFVGFEKDGFELSFVGFLKEG